MATHTPAFLEFLEKHADEVLSHSMKDAPFVVFVCSIISMGMIEGAIHELRQSKDAGAADDLLAAETQKDWLSRIAMDAIQYIPAEIVRRFEQLTHKNAENDASASLTTLVRLTEQN